ncbi:MAG TPA: hypothetical protein VJ302_26045 [Blastocatellia bacterium]|nr:hypothetical protein [Blastocatellia bacterium]
MGPLILMMGLMGACGAPVQNAVSAPEGSRAVYPPVIEDTPARQEEVQEAWKNLLTELKLPVERLELEPVIDTPRALPMNLTGQINLKKTGVFGEMEAKDALRNFIERTKGILTGDPKSTTLTLKDLSLVSFSDDGTFYRAAYHQATYPFPMANGYGELRLTVDKNGKLLQWGSTLIPQFELPVTPEIKPGQIVDRLINTEFEYTNFAGQPQRYKVTKREEIVIKDTVIFPRLEGQKITVHLAFAVEVGKGMTWTVYFDAINGQRLGEKQNFAT